MIWTVEELGSAAASSSIPISNKKTQLKKYENKI